MTKKIIGNLEVTNNITSNGNNISTSVNSIKADSNGNIELDMTSMNTTGSYGDSFVVNESGNIISDSLTKYARLVSNNEFENEKNTIISWSEIFNTWYRFSHLGSTVPPALPTELNGWSYNNTTNQIYSTINSTSYIGLVSPEKYDNFNLEVNLSSTNADDDAIGLVIAFVKIGVREYTLSAIRGCGGQNHSVDQYWAIVYNKGQSDQKIITNNTTYPFTTGSAGIGWNGFPNGSNVKIQRTGNNIHAETTDFSDPNTYIAPLSVDLTSDPVLEKFINPCKVGYSAYSQAAATFKTISFSGGNIILNIDTNEVWEYNFNSSSWEKLVGITATSQLQKGYTYSNSNTKVSYILYDENTIKVVAGTSTGNSSSDQVPSMKYFESSLNSTGYQKYPSGMAESWGIMTAVTNVQVQKVLQIPYEEIYNIQTQIIYNSSLTESVVIFATYNISTNSIILNSSSTTPVDLYYRVIGKI